jgi:hypothetical protein
MDLVGYRKVLKIDEKRLVHLYLYLYGGHVLNVCGHVS